MKRTLLAALCLSTLVACGDDDKDGNNDGNVTVSCNWDADDECISVTASQAAINASEYTRTSCEGDGGTFGSGCSSANRVGRCTFSDGTFSVVDHLYSPTWTTEAAQTACTESGGTFAAN